MRHALLSLLVLISGTIHAASTTVTTTADQTITGQKIFSGTNKLCVKDPSDTDKACLVAPALGSATITLTLPSTTSTIATLADIAGGGFGDVTGPGSATDGAWALFDGTTGKLLKNGSVPAAVASSGSASDLGSGTLNCARTPALTGDVTTSAGSCSTTISNNAVTNAKSAQMAAHRFKGNNTGSTADPIDLTATELTAELNALVGDSGSGGTKGLVPAPAAGDAAASKFLKADGTWTAAGGGGAWTRLDEIVTSGSQATVDFTSISGAYRILKIFFVSADTQAGTASVVMRVRINNDTTSGHYTAAQYEGEQGGSGVHTTMAASSGGVFVCGNPQSGNSSISNNGELMLVQYANTSWHKRIHTQCSYDDGTVGLSTFSLSARWISTAAITRVTFTTDGTAFANGSVFTLYGIN